MSHLERVLTTDPLAEVFPPLTEQEALVESNRCLYCYDAPCTHACPTHIDIPKFIKKIATGNLLGSAKTILDSNLLGATCARVCPVQELCEGACVLGAEHRPIMIGRLQRHAMDSFAGGSSHPLPPPSFSDNLPGDSLASTEKTRDGDRASKVAVIGAGPAGLSCAGSLARLGHRVTIFEKRELPGGLSTYGIIGLREPVEVSIAEVEMIRQMGVEIRTGVEIESLADLPGEFGVVFLSVGLGATPAMDIPGEELILDGLSYIEDSKLRPREMRIGRHVVVIGAGNTAVDCATVAKRLGADRVTMVYRRTEAEMSAYPHEYEFIKREGVEFRFLTQPIAVLKGGSEASKLNGKVPQPTVIGLECIRMALGAPDASGRRAPEAVPDSEFVLECDQVVKAIGQEKPTLARSLGLEVDKGFLRVDENFETSLPDVYAGGDCIRARGSASTVMAVQDGKMAAAAIHRRLLSSQKGTNALDPIEANTAEVAVN